MPTQTAVSCLTALLALATACSAEPGNSLPTDLLCAACDSPTGDSTPDADAPDARSPDARMPPLPHGQVLLPPGAFFMGAHPGEACTSEGETPRHQVTLTRGLVAFDHEVTAAEWAETTGLPVPGLPPAPDPEYFCTDPDCPVAWLNWFEAAWYANRLSEKDGLQPCYDLVDCTGTPGTGCKGLEPCEGDYRCAALEWPDPDCEGWRLPTEAEWEYLARGGTGAAFGFPYPYGGDKNSNCTQCEPEANLQHAGWYCDNAGLLSHPVRQLIPNAALVYDASGNVYEWCFDWKGDYPHHDVTDPVGPPTGQLRTARGGSFLDNPRHCRLAYRNGFAPTLRSRNLGLRLLRHAAGAPLPRSGQDSSTDGLRPDPPAGEAPLASAGPSPLRPPAFPSGGSYLSYPSYSSYSSYCLPAAPAAPTPPPPTPAPQPCTPDEGCGEGTGTYCGSEGVCVPCDDALHCGPDCGVCTSPTPVCVNGACAECPADNYCPTGKWCDSGTCVPCTQDDPEHCGATCEKCWGTAPACVEGHCRCAGDSCGPFQICDAGKCALCNVPARCGEACQPCPAGHPFCRFDALGCVQCLADSHCGPGMKCQDDACIPDCKAEGCFGLPAVPGNDCSNAPVVGRVPAGRGVRLPGNTATGQSSGSPGRSETVCKADGLEQVVSVYLAAGDTLSVLLTPMDSWFDATLQVRSGRGCLEGEVVQLLSCSSASGDGSPESLDVSAKADGWITVVVDGAEAGREAHDFGFYLLDLVLTCAHDGCCCL